MENVLINQTDTSHGETTIYFIVPSLNIDSQYKMSSDEFVKQLGEGGFKGLGNYILKQLDIGIQALLKE